MMVSAGRKAGLRTRSSTRSAISAPTRLSGMRDLNPLQHYHLTGWLEGRDPSAGFDTRLYLLRNPDVAAVGVDPLEHYPAVMA